MSKDKSLGSSPIGFNSSNSNNFHFIPDLGVAKESDTATQLDIEEEEIGESKDEISFKRNNYQNKKVEDRPRKNGLSKDKDKPQKKIVSYYLEKSLIDKVKKKADEKNLYYSKLVSDALRYWLKLYD